MAEVLVHSLPCTNRETAKKDDCGRTLSHGINTDRLKQILYSVQATSHVFSSYWLSSMRSNPDTTKSRLSLMLVPLVSAIIPSGMTRVFSSRLLVGNFVSPFEAPCSNDVTVLVISECSYEWAVPWGFFLQFSRGE